MPSNVLFARNPNIVNFFDLCAISLPPGLFVIAATRPCRLAKRQTRDACWIAIKQHLHD
jgi:hypothetical protein